MPNWLVGDLIELQIPEPTAVRSLPKIFRLKWYMKTAMSFVINKPRGLVVHPALGHTSGTLVNALMYHCKDLSGINGELRPESCTGSIRDTSAC